jgi:hypothetical protein
MRDRLRATLSGGQGGVPPGATPKIGINQRGQ